MKFIIKHKKNNNYRVDGFTFVEVLVSLGILMFGILMFLLMNAEAIKGNTYGSQILYGNSIAQNAAEFIYTIPVNTMDTNGNYLSEGLHTGNNTTGPTGVVYSPQWTVASIPGTQSRNITVEVKWNEKGTLLPHKITMKVIR